MSQTHHSQRLRNECWQCGSRMKHLGKSEPMQNGHHATVFYCKECDREVLRG